MIRYDRLEAEAEGLRHRYAAAKPFPHIVLEDFLEPDVAEAAYARFPSLDAMSALKTFRVDKAQDPLLDKFDPTFGQIIFGHLHSERFLRFVGALTGVS